MPETYAGIDLNEIVDFHLKSYTVKPLGGGKHTRLEIACFDKNVKSLVHYHPNADETYYVIEGEAIYRQDKRIQADAGEQIKRKGFRNSFVVEEIKAKAGFLMSFAPNRIHQVESLTKLRLLKFFSSPNGDFSAIESEDWESIQPPE
ncbi:MAG TPA: cupin domain-containing protein [Candidatus Bathyarchaeia archaeon]|nr:cupin domain-containing protein [Candidatus Bathyarchaeia archaeon]